MQAADVAVADVRALSYADLDGVGEPAVEIGAEGYAVVAERNPVAETVERRAELVLHLLARLAVEVLTLALAVCSVR